MSLHNWLKRIEVLPYHPDAHFNFQQSLELAARLNLKKYLGFTIAVTGTNGKGSVVTALERYCVAQGLTCGALTSPHIKRFNERIRMNGQEIADQHIISAFEKIEQCSRGLALHYFHYVYFAGLLLFAELNPQVIILEVGVGGRLDPINVIENDMTIITNVDYDHCDFLGNTLEKIALEKAQLIRPKTPVIFGDSHCPQAILDVVKERQAQLYQFGSEYSYQMQEQEWTFNFNDQTYPNLPIPNIILNNAATAMMASLLLPFSKKENFSFQLFWRNFSVPGRMQWLEHLHRTWLFDVAHNPQSARYLAEVLKKQKHRFGKICAFFTVGRKKDVVNMIKPMLDVVDEWIIVTLPDKRIANIEEIEQIFRQFSATCYYYADIQNAYQKLLGYHTKENDLIIVWGSFLMVDAALNIIGD